MKYKVSKPDNFVYLGNYDEDFVSIFEKEYQSEPAKYKGEVEHTKSLDDVLNEVIKKAKEFGSDIGVDLEKRMPALEHFHFFDKPNFLKTWSMHNGNKYVGQGGFGIIASSDMLILHEAENLDLTIKRANHELIHILSYKEIFLDQSRKKFVSRRLGFWNMNIKKYKLLNEAFTELLNIYLLKNYWLKSDKLPKFKKDQMPIAYSEMLIFLDAILYSIASDRKEKYHELVLIMARDMFLGSDEIIKIIDKEINSAFSSRFSTLDINELNDLEKCQELAKFLGLTDLSREIDSILQTE